MKPKSRCFCVLTVLFALAFCIPAVAEDLGQMIDEMITAYSQSSKGVQDEAFKEKVNEIDNHLREKLEKDLDVTPFTKLWESAKKFNSRSGARAMFAVVLEKALKRINFTKAQQEIKDREVLANLDQMAVQIENYLSPNQIDDDTVDRKKLEANRKKLIKKIQSAKAAAAKMPAGKRISVEVTKKDGTPGKLSGSREANLLAKLKTVVNDPGEMKVTVTLKDNDLFDMTVEVKNFVAPNGFAVVEGTMSFADVGLAALDDSNATEVSALLGDEYFKKYKVVQNDEQLNVIPNSGSAAYEMGSLQPGQSYKMEFKKPDGISAILKELEGNTEIAVLNQKTAVTEKALEMKNTGTRNLIYLQGTDITGLCSVKAVGFLIPKDGHVNFREALLIVDDQMSTELTKFVGEQGINFFLKKASDNLRKGMPFTPILENISFERTPDGHMVYIFSGRGKNNQ